MAIIKITKGKDLEVGKIYKFSFGEENLPFMVIEITSNQGKYSSWKEIKIMTKNGISMLNESGYGYQKAYSETWFDELSSE